MHVATIVNTEDAITAEPIFWVENNIWVIYCRDVALGIIFGLFL